ncbi:MAG: DUF6328 family protein [Candidatus Nitrosocosmicus sp.]
MVKKDKTNNKTKNNNGSNNNDKDEDKIKGDFRIANYESVLKEIGVLTSLSGILFGFILNASIRIKNGSTILEDDIVLLIALFSITVSISCFIMPVIYHHLQFPYSNVEKFIRRAHRFIVFGLIPLFVTLFLGLETAISSVINQHFSYALASIPFAIVLALYKMRKFDERLK